MSIVPSMRLYHSWNGFFSLRRVFFGCVAAEKEFRKIFFFGKKQQLIICQNEVNKSQYRRIFSEPTSWISFCLPPSPFSESDFLCLFKFLTAMNASEREGWRRMSAQVLFLLLSKQAPIVCRSCKQRITEKRCIAWSQQLINIPVGMSCV